MDDIEPINDQIATKVMGWEYLRIGYFGTEDETLRQIELLDWIGEHQIESVGEYWIKAGTHFWLRKENWTPNKDIRQAFMAAQKILAKTHYFELYCNEVSIDSIPGIWNCTLLSHPPNGMIWEATAPLAICKACLEAVSVKEIVSEK